MGADLCRTLRIRICRDVCLTEIVAVLLQILISKFLIDVVGCFLLVGLEGQLGGSAVSGKYGTSRIVRISLAINLIAHRLQLL